MRRGILGATGARRAIAVLAVSLAGCVAAPPRSPPGGAESPRVSPIAARRAHVDRMRQHAASLPARSPARREADVALADALAATAEAHLDEAVSIDPSAAHAPPPEDTAAGRRATGAEEEGDAPEPEGPPAPPRRSESALASLRPAARAHVEAHDALLVEAAALYATARVAPRAELDARRARALDAIGQREEASRAWYAVLRSEPNGGDAFEAWLAFIARFAARGDAAAVGRAKERATEAAKASRDRGAACARATRLTPRETFSPLCDGAAQEKSALRIDSDPRSKPSVGNDTRSRSSVAP